MLMETLSSSIRWSKFLERLEIAIIKFSAFLKPLFHLHLTSAIRLFLNSQGTAALAQRESGTQHCNPTPPASNGFDVCGLRGLSFEIRFYRHCFLRQRFLPAPSCGLQWAILFP